MSNCCGAKRANLAANAGSGTPATTPTRLDIRLRLLRPMDLTLRGSVTGRDYHFTRSLPSVLVASADVDGLLSFGGLARVS